MRNERIKVQSNACRHRSDIRMKWKPLFKIACCMRSPYTEIECNLRLKSIRDSRLSHVFFSFSFLFFFLLHLLSLSICVSHHSSVRSGTGDRNWEIKIFFFYFGKKKTIHDFKIRSVLFVIIFFFFFFSSIFFSFVSISINWRI